MKSKTDISQKSEKKKRRFDWRELFWNPWENRLPALIRIIYFGIIFIIIYLGLDLLLGGGLNLLGISPVDTTSVAYFVVNASLRSFLPFAGIIIALWFASRFIDKRPMGEYGLHFSGKWWMDLGIGLIIGVILLAGVFGLELAFGWVSILQTGYSSLTLVPFWLGLLMYFIFYVAVGFFEESLVRGYLLRNIAEGLKNIHISPRVAIGISLGISSIVFGFLHMGNPSVSAGAITLLALAGVFLGLGYVLTGNLGLSIGIHIAWNFAEGIFFGFPVSGVMSEFAVFRISQTGPTLFTGGDFGPEGGLMGLLIIVLGMGLVFLYVKLIKRKIQIDPAIATYLSIAENHPK
jgi:membrane protease YdiL (CAAX protease family)